MILAETGVEKISFGSVNFNAFDDCFIDFLSATRHKLRATRHFHIPLQSGCNKTLRRMNRKYTIEDYKKVIAKLRKKIPGVTFSTDVMVGFPGETEEEFEESFKNIKEIGFAKLHVFRYSSRKRTLAEKMEKIWGEVDNKDKIKRSEKLRKLVRIKR